jgi:cytoskeletal protein RodZ
MPDTIGQRLKKEREARYLTLEKACEDTRIRIVFLQAFESDDYSNLPSVAQARGFLRNYAEYLGLNLEEMIADIHSAPPVEISGPLPEVNLSETESPILDDADEKPARYFSALRAMLAARFGRRAVEQVDDSTSASGEVSRIDNPTPGEGRVTNPTYTGEDEQSQVKDEAHTGFISKIISAFQFRIAKPAPEPEEEPVPIAEPSKPLLPADQIFQEIGAQLRSRRELISLTVEEVERHTKLRAAFIKALEAGDYDKLPSPVQTRGMLANYASFLDIDAEKILLRFADGLQARRHEKYAETPRENIQTQVKPSIPFLRSFIAGDLIFGVAIIVILVGLAVWGVGRVVSAQDTPIEPTAPPISDVLSGNLPTQQSAAGVTFVPVDEGLATPTLAELTADAPPTVASSANVVVSVFAVERVFARISVDGKVVFEGRLTPRETKVFEANDQVVVLTGNAAALRITYNGSDLGAMGSVGEVVSRVYLVTGIATPTATISPTPTNTSPATMTPTPTQTPTFTPPPSP